MKKRRILLTLESRATYGYSRNVLREIKKYENLEPLTLVTGIHLIDDLGSSIDLIENDGFIISSQVELEPKECDGNARWSIAMGKAIADFAKEFKRLKPDIILLFGDRGETISLCIAAAYMNIPIAHVQAGDKSGHIDDAARYAIAKLSHIHFASCADSAERVRKLGEQDFRIHNVGAPQLDDIEGRVFPREDYQIGKDTIFKDEKYFMIIFHPVFIEEDEIDEQLSNIRKALEEYKEYKFIWIYPNSDFGYEKIIKFISNITSKNYIFTENLDRDLFLAILANSSALIGNSSSGILEAPSFNIPVINIGNRQRGRQQADNIINCGYDHEGIQDAINHALTDQMFIEKCSKSINPYGDGKSSKRICDILEFVDIDKKLLDKQITY